MQTSDSLRALHDPLIEKETIQLSNMREVDYESQRDD